MRIVRASVSCVDTSAISLQSNLPALHLNFNLVHRERCIVSHIDSRMIKKAKYVVKEHLSQTETAPRSHKSDNKIATLKIEEPSTLKQIVTMI